MRFRCVAMDTKAAERFRATGLDDYGRTVVRRIAAGGEPCRHCLGCAEPGEEMLLLSSHLPRPLGVYWTPSPVFLHARACEAFVAQDQLPEAVTHNSLVSVRAYDAGGMCLYDLGVVSLGEEAQPGLERALEDSRTAFVNIHTARPGCWLCAAERVT